MIDINPQLQSKIFDSLLLHMKAERKGSRHLASRAAIVRGKTPRNKVAAGKVPSGKSARPAPAADSSPQWDSLAADLNRLGLHKTTADALVSWAASQAEQSRQSPVKIRVLHPMEREFISVEAYDYLLELYRLGLIGPPQLEQLIENCAFLTSLPATREQIGKMALRAFAENLELQGLGSSH
ncbi:MAG: hypothetical protein JWO30_2830 [Fibrobacteres bacterium]|nr:hypothetical protein [Fibrobacterota bacterium]